MMIPQEPSVALLVDYLYDLLDAVERQQVEERLRTSEAWRKALAQAEREQQIFAEAAKTDFSNVKFDPPKATPRQQPKSVAKPPKRSSWLRWAIAACIAFLVIGGLASGGRWLYLKSGVWNASEKVAELKDLVHQRQAAYQAGRLQTRENLREIQEQLESLVKKWSGDLENAEKANGKIRVVVQGPQTVQAGAENTFQIVTQPASQPARQPGRLVRQNRRLKLTTEVIDPQAKDAVVYSKVMACNVGQRCPVSLPPEKLRLEPGRNLYLRVTAKDPEGNVETVTEQLPIVGTTYMTHLTTDRPLYKPGETVHFRSMTLDRFGLKPPQDRLEVNVEIQGPGIAKPVLKRFQGTAHVTSETATSKKAAKRSTLLKGPDGRPIRGISSGDWTIPADASGGEYTIVVSSPTQKFPTQVRTFLVQKYRMPRLNKELEFNGKSYGPGDTVGFRAKASFVEGGKSFAGKTAIISVSVDGVRVRLKRTKYTTNAEGEIRVEFDLPKTITKGSGSVSVLFLDKGLKETIVRQIPIVLNTLYVQFYPEGGDLVADVPNRVYFEVTRPNGKPADLRGALVDNDGTPVAILSCNGRDDAQEVETLRDDDKAGVNQGMGVFTFVPQFGQRYHLKLTRPIGVQTKNHPRAREPYAVLPRVRNNGIVLNVPDGVVTNQVEMTLRNVGVDRTLMVGVYCRGRELARKEAITVKAGETHSLSLKPNAPIGGVYRVTVFEKVEGHYTERAERLIYRRPIRKLKFRVTPDKKLYAPGDPVSVTIQATDETGQPAKAIVGVSVIDKSNLKLADDKTIRSMPTHFYLASEIKQPKDLEYADFLVSDNSKAEQALDLLLGTQGWRRFIEVNPTVNRKRNLQRNRFETIRADHLPVASARVWKSQDSSTIRKQNVDVKHAPKVVEILDKQTQTENVRRQIENQLLSKADEVDVKVQQARRAKDTAEKEFHQYSSWVGGAALLTFGIVLFLVAIICGIAGLMQAKNSKTGANFAVCFILLALLFVGLCVMVVTNSKSQVTFNTVSNKLAAGEAAAPKMAQANKDMAAEAAPEEKGVGGANFDGPMKLKMAPGPVPPQAPGMRLAPQKGVAPKPEALMPARGPEGQFLAQADAAQPDEERPERGGNVVGANPAEPRFDPAPGAFAPPPRRLRPGRRPGMPIGEVWNMEQQLEAARRAGRYQEVARLLLKEDREIAGIPEPKRPFVVREYAYRNPRNTAEKKSDVRTSFLETLYWNPVEVLKDGKTKIAFDINDSVTTFQIKVLGHTLDGRIGSTTTEIASRLPFSISPLVPNELSNTDELTVPVTVFNDTKGSRQVTLKGQATALDFVGTKEQTVNVASRKNNKVLFQLKPTITEGTAALLMQAKSKPFGRDAVKSEISIFPEGFPFVGARSDTLDRPVSHTIDLPKQLVPGSFRCRVRVYPSVVSELQRGLDGMLREPYGCFEQTSSSNYPNVMILSYLKQTKKAAPELEERARRLIDKGYKRLVSFECRHPTDNDKRGYEWFGGTAPPHEALTAYGLLQFKDLAAVYDNVDAEMLKRTENYLLGQRDGEGGFKRNKRALDQFGRAPDHVTDAYIVWSLTEIGTKADLSKEFQALQAKAKDSDDPYFLSLVSLGLLNTGKTKDAVAILKKVANKQDATGSVDGAQTSITHSGGRDLQIETTSLALIAWLRADGQLAKKQGKAFLRQSQAAAKWIGQQRGGFGGFGSTQSTILALKALIAHAKENSKTSKSGDLIVYLKDNETGKLTPVAVEEFNAGHQGEIVAEVPADKLKLFRPGKNEIEIRLANNKLPYTSNWTYNTLRPNNPVAAPVHLTTKLDRTKAKEGETVQLSLKVENKTGVGQGMTVAVIGLPAGLQLPSDRKELKELAARRDKSTKPGKIAAWEERGRELILYWRNMAPNQKPIEIDLTLICKYPGKFRGPASRAYLYYRSAQKYWVDPLTMEIDAK